MLRKYLYSSSMICFYLISTVISESTKDYGPFNLTITDFELCKGPKQKDCASASATINSYNTMFYQIDVLNNFVPTKGKITALSNGKEFLRLQIKKPCDHLFLKPLLGALVNLTDECIIPKGKHKVTIDIQNVAKSYFGGTFVFGNWTFKSLFYNEECNFSCSVIKVTLFPLNKQ